MAVRLPRPRDARDFERWARDFADFMERIINDPNSTERIPAAVALSSLQQSLTGNLKQEKALLPGVLMYDVDAERPAFSNGSEWVPLVSGGNLPVIQYAAAAIDATATVVTFPEEFANSPIVTVTAAINAGDNATVVPTIYAVGTTSFTCELRLVDNSFQTNVRPTSGTIHWIALGTP